MKRWINAAALRASWTKVGPDVVRSKNAPATPIFVLEENDLETAWPPETPEVRLQRVERCMLALTAEWMQLTGLAEPPMPVHPGVLSPAEWSALFEARIWAEGSQAVPLTADERKHLAAAVAKLTDIATASKPNVGFVEPSRESIDAVGRIMQAAWAKAEPDHGVTKFPASYWATFADMARAVLVALRSQAAGSGT